MFKFLWQLLTQAKPCTSIFDKKLPAERHMFDRFQWNGGRLLNRKELDDYQKAVNSQKMAVEQKATNAITHL